MKNNLTWLLILALTCVVTLIPDRYSYSSPRPFEVYIKSKNDVIREVFCKTEDAQKFARSKVIANIELRIKDFIYTSGDSKYIGINYGEYTRSGKDTTTNKDIHESFIQSVKKYNSEKEYAQYIHEKK